MPPLPVISDDPPSPTPPKKNNNTKYIFQEMNNTLNTNEKISLTPAVPEERPTSPPKKKVNFTKRNLHRNYISSSSSSSS